MKLVKYISSGTQAHFQLLAKDTTCASRKSKVETVLKDVTPSDRQQCAFFRQILLKRNEEYELYFNYHRSWNSSRHIGEIFFF